MRVRFAAALCALALAPLPLVRAQAPPAPATSPVPAARSRASTRTLAATVLVIDPPTESVRLALADGTTVAALLKDTSRFYKRSKIARIIDFVPNEKVTARLSFRPGGEVWVSQLFDAPSYAAYTRDRREVCVGIVAANTGNRLDVKRADGTILAFRVTDKSQVRKAGALSQIKAYPVGAAVAVQPRGLPSGEVMAAIVADTAVDVAAARLDGLVNWEGTLETVDPARSYLVLRRSDGVSRPIAVAPSARIRRGKATLTLAQLTPGTAVTIHLLRGADANGLRTSDSIRVVVPKATAPTKL